MERYSVKYPFSSKIECGICGCNYVRRMNEKRKDGTRKNYWACFNLKLTKTNPCHLDQTTWKKSSNGKIMESDVVIAKNYLSKDEINDLEGIVGAFLEIAENSARRHIPMTMRIGLT